MAKRILLLLSCVFCLQFAVAQKMSDEQIKSFILTEQEKGTNRRTIAAMLLSKGVSPDRLRNIQTENSESNENLMGVSELDDKKTLDSHLREETEAPQEEETLEKVEATMEGMDEAPKIYGRNIFNNKLLTFESSKNIPIPSNYILGAGDVVVIDIWGASQDIIEARITPEGKIFVDRVGPLHLAGKKLADANQYVRDVLGNIYAESSINLTVGATRSIVVQVLGEVVVPGTYTLSSLSTAFNALYAAGGIGSIGTLRAINVFRGGKKVSTIDVYDYIFNGNLKGNITLQDNDIISVGPYDAIVNIEGKVKRPMMYELKEGESLSTLLNFSGGFTGDAYTEKLRVTRKSGKEYSLYTVERKDVGSFDLFDGDAVYVDEIISRFSNMIEISGAVFFPGQYQLSEEINSVAELIKAAGGVREDAFLDRAVLHHRNYDNTIEAQSIDIKGIINGTVADVELRNNDVIFIPSESDMKGEQVVTVNGEVNFPGEYKFAENTTLGDIILQAGGLTRAASVAKIDVSRQLYDPSALAERDTLVQIFTFDIKNGFVVDGNADFVLEPFDEVNIRRSPAFEKIKNVQVMGEVLFQGTYALQSKNVRLSDIIKQAGGVSNSAYVAGAKILRKITSEEKNTRAAMRKQNLLEYYENLLEIDNSSDATILDRIASLKQEDDEYYSIAIDLEDAMKNPGGDSDIFLCADDIIKVPQMVSSVRVSGEVNHPLSVTFKEGKPLKWYIKNAGGYTNKSKKRGCYVINMDGSVKKVSRFNKSDIKPGCEILVPRKKQRRDMTTGEIVTIGTSVASLATMLATVVNLLK